MNILVTGGTVFASRFTAEYFVKKGHDVYVINRNSRPQSEGVKLINCDRHNLGDTLKNFEFNLVIDITAYNESDIIDLLNGLGKFENYVMISSSAVYSETLPLPFKETQPVGENIHWGDYGTNKISAEKALLEQIPNAYILRPPYLYGAMNNLYREAFVFDCAEKDMPFYVPKDGKMPLQFFDIEDMCKFIEIIIDKKPEQHIFNVGNPQTVDINEWVRFCYSILGKMPEIRFVTGNMDQRDYFPFLDYGYVLDVTKQQKLMSDVKPLEQGLKESYEWYKNHKELVRRKSYLSFINKNFN